ncbi:MAG: hypothetical protein HC877_23785 [Thioploca sp.]|nr:hypothetical protein [Thioploca sp.]
MIQTEQPSLENFKTPFHNVPIKKLDTSIALVKRKISNPIDLSALITAFNQYYIANIPVDYWFRDMDAFVGPKVLSKRYGEMTENIDLTYSEGLKMCFAGSHGTGKTFVCSCILKRVVETGKYNGLYVNLTDIINVLLSSDKEEGRKLLLETDF